MTQMTQILYFFLAHDKDLGEAPLKKSVSSASSAAEK